MAGHTWGTSSASLADTGWHSPIRNCLVIGALSGAATVRGSLGTRLQGGAPDGDTAARPRSLRALEGQRGNVARL
ncbi:hypothetical protein GCM10009610_29360 [Pseudonocardia xinjiangensis]